MFTILNPDFTYMYCCNILKPLEYWISSSKIYLRKFLMADQ